MITTIYFLFAGLQESKIICVDTDLGNPVNPMNCRADERPEVIVRTCNDHPCPPRWNVSDFSRCSKSCGGGVQVTFRKNRENLYSEPWGHDEHPQ